MSINLSPSDEALLMSSVKTAVELVDVQGLSPDEAFKKIAVDRRLTPGMITTACHAFNTGRQLAQWETNDNALDKLASFPLADAAAVVEHVFGAKEKQARYDTHDPYDPIPLADYRTRWREVDFANAEKVAEQIDTPKPVLESDFDVACKRQRLAKKAHESARLAADAAEAKLAETIEVTRRYFRKSAYDREALGTVEFASRVQFGPAAGMLFDAIANGLPQNEKRANDLPLTWSGFAKVVDYAQQPYASIRQAIEFTSDVFRTRAALKVASDEMREADAFFDRYKPKAPTQTFDTLLGPVEVPIEKDAGVDFSDLAFGYLGKRVGELSANQAANNKLQVEEYMQDFDDADHINELRKIRAQTALSQLMSDPEDPISQADPNSVLNAYNSLIRLAPRLADQPEALGPLLRKRMVGNTEPFEASEALKLDESLKKTQQLSLPSPGAASSD